MLILRAAAGTPCLGLGVPPQVLPAHILGGYIQVEHGEPGLVGGVARDDECRRCTIVRANEQLGGLAVLAEAGAHSLNQPLGVVLCQGLQECLGVDGDRGEENELFRGSAVVDPNSVRLELGLERHEFVYRQFGEGRSSLAASGSTALGLAFAGPSVM